MEVRKHILHSTADSCPHFRQKRHVNVGTDERQARHAISVRGMDPFPWLQSQTHQTVRERREVCWVRGATVPCRRRFFGNRATKHFFTLLSWKRRLTYHRFDSHSSMLAIPRTRRPSKQVDLILGGDTDGKGRVAVSLPFVQPMRGSRVVTIEADSKRERKSTKCHKHLRFDAIHVIDLYHAHNEGFTFCETAHGGVLCFERPAAWNFSNRAEL